MAAHLKAGLSRFPHVDSILGDSIELSDGSVLDVEGIESDLGLVKSAGYDVWELPIVRYTAARDVGFDVTAIPVFLSRRFIQWMIELPEDSEVQEPKDLEGKRIVQALYDNTDSIWTKGILEEDYGVDLSSVSWLTRVPEVLPGAYIPPGLVCLDRAGQEDQMNRDILVEGLADVAFSSGHRDALEPGVRRLWADPEGGAAEWHSQAQVFPILHVIVVRNAALAAHPSLAGELFQIFERAKSDALVKWNYGASLPEEMRPAALWSGFPGSAWHGRDRSFLGQDPIPYGLDVEANVEALERVLRYAHRQGVLRQMHAVEDLFAPVTS